MMESMTVEFFVLFSSVIASILLGFISKVMHTSKAIHKVVKVLDGGKTRVSQFDTLR